MGIRRVHKANKRVYSARRRLGHTRQPTYRLALLISAWTPFSRCTAVLPLLNNQKVQRGHSAHETLGSRSDARHSTLSGFSSKTLVSLSATDRLEANPVRRDEAA